MLAPSGNHNVLVARAYPKEMEAWRFQVLHEVNRVRFANLPSDEATIDWIRRILNELRRISGWRLTFEHVSITAWLPIDGPPTTKDLGRILQDVIGTENPSGYDLVVALRPYRTGDPAWDDLGLEVYDGYVPPGFAYITHALNATVISTIGLEPVAHSRWDLTLGVHEIGHMFGLGHEEPPHSGLCVMRGDWVLEFCPSCLATLGWS